MSYIACPFCGGGVPGMPCRCQTSAIPFSPQPLAPATLPPTAPEEELLRRIEELEALVEALTAKGEKADKMERALRWIGYKSPIIDASPATIQRHARAALAEMGEDD